MRDDPHDRCRFANDARLDRTPEGGHRIVWPCGLNVTISGVDQRRRYYLPELNDLHEQARIERAAETRRKSETAKRSNRNRRRTPNAAARETVENPPPRNTVTTP